jgi:O-antigen/teichoic acid export membrane protein
MSDIRSKMASGAGWMVLFKLLDKSIGLISTLLLARLLLPADFGIVAMAVSFIALLEVFGAFGFDLALIQRAQTTREHFDTAWTFNVAVGTGIAVMMLALSPVIARFYERPELVPVVCTLALASAIQGFENIGVVMFRKDLDFAREFRFLFGKRLIAVLVTIPLALWLRSYWALVLGTLSARGGGVSLSYLMQPYRPRFSLAARRDLLGFSKWVLLNNALAFFKERSPDFVIGRIVGPHGLGIFNVSSELANMPGTELVAPINRAILPAYARLAHDIPALRVEYLAVMGMVALLAVPAVAGIGATAKLIVSVLLGPNWHDAQLVLTILAFFGITQVMQSNAYAAYLAIGRPDIPTRVTAVHVVVLLGSLISLTLHKGLMGAALAYLLTAAIMVPLTFAFLFPRLGLLTRPFLAVVWRPVVAAGVMYLVVRGFVDVRTANDPSTAARALLLIVAVLLGIFVYTATAALLWIASGRPDGAERAVTQRAVQIATRLWTRVQASRRAESRRTPSSD